MKNTKRIVGLVLAGVLLFSNSGTNYQLMASEVDNTNIETSVNEKENNKKLAVKEEKKLKVSNIKERKEFKHLSNKNKEKVNQAIAVAKVNGRKAGKLINEMENSEVRQVGIKEVLDTYYSAETVDTVAISEFSDSLEEDIKQEIFDYTEAREERDNQENCDYVVGEELVVFDKNTTKEEINKVVSYISDSYEIILDNDFVMDESLSERKKERLKALETYKGNIVVKVNLDLDQTVEGAKEEFEEYECVTLAEKNELMEVDTIQDKLNDTYASLQWYLTRAKFGIAWDSQSTAGCDDMWIAVLDTGCKMNHKDLTGNLVINKSVDVTKKDNNGNYVKLTELSKQYDSAHGTNCAGVITAQANNSIGIAGAAKGWDNSACRVMAIKVSNGLNSDGSEVISSEDVCKGIRYAVDAGAEIISISISGTSAKVYQADIEYAEEAGVIVVASAGNKGNSIKRYPAALDYVIAVGGTNSSNKKSDFSNYGSWVDIVAPAENFVSTSTETQYEKGLNGTSFSTPLVAAAIGLMKSMNPTLSVEQIKNYLNSTSTDINSEYLECGLLNAGLAVQRAKYEEFKNSTVTLKSVTALENNKIKINGDLLNVYGTEGVEIYRATSKDGTYTKIKTLTGESVEKGTCSYTDTDLKTGKTYYYKIRAFMKYGSGYKYTPYSNIKSATAKE